MSAIEVWTYQWGPNLEKQTVCLSVKADFSPDSLEKFANDLLARVAEARAYEASRIEAGGAPDA